MLIIITINYNFEKPTTFDLFIYTIKLLFFVFIIRLYYNYLINVYNKNIYDILNISDGVRIVNTLIPIIDLYL